VTPAHKSGQKQRSKFLESPFVLLGGVLIFLLAGGAAGYGIMLAWKAAERGAAASAQVERLRGDVEELRARLDRMG